ncbi:hypothetical protein V6N11_053589 [Hibiscus sabdariffa]|uniref:Protein kinase domain-containing protein n=1 Tax=Hibiscus sabdariffa TaxID=183260 RepID=A0ABR2UDZ1_9ROSI
MLLLFLSFVFFTSPSPSLSLNQEGLYLLQVKASLSDPDSALSSWNPRDPTPCNWRGVSCDSATASVTSLDLSNANVAGPFPSALCRLQNLTSINLFYNINSTIPSDISTCQNLVHLVLAQNLLTGELPNTLADLPNLKYLDLTGNNISGDFPDSFGRFQKLEVLSLVYNLLDGTIPAFLGNISTLKMLNLSYNPFSPGRIPPELGNLTNLEILWLTECNLVGEIPNSLGRLKKLTDLDLAFNNLVGNIPGSLTELVSVVQIELYNNSLTGELPRGFSNLTQLRLLDASMNQLTGTIPDELTQLPLESLNLYQNYFEGTLPSSLADSPALYELRLFQNRLTGELPVNLGKNSPLRWLDVSSNQFSGPIPPNLCEKGNLEELLMIYNSFSGHVPSSLSECRSLNRIRLGYNKLSGEIPDGFWGLPHVYLLELVNNSFSGQIGKSIAKAANLSLLILSRNEFNGSLPEEIGLVDNLLQLSASNNKFSGPLPESIVKLDGLQILDLHGNKLEGELPSRIESLKKLNELDLAKNEFSGKIPDGIGSLSVLNYLDLSNNQLTGTVPFSLQHLKLNQLNLSNNLLSGELPPLFDEELYRSSFMGNPGLCGDIGGLCAGRDGDKHKGYVLLFRSIFVLAALVLVVGVVWFYFKYRSYKKAKATDKSKWTLMSFHKLGFSEYEILDCLDEDNVIGRGSSGKVYKVVLSNGEAVAVKKLWRGMKKGCESADLGKAEGLSYLHHDCVPPIVHRDVKSNNILLDGDFGARVADFGVAKVVDVAGKGAKSMSVIAGSCGYIAPEYAYTLRVNEKSDIFSFGVVILELVTGRLPIDPEYGEKDLVRWVCTTLEQKGVDHVLDSKLDPRFKDEMHKVLNIGLLCTSPLPINRPSMRRVVKMMQEAGAENQQKAAAKKDGKLSPYYYEDGSDH